VVHGTALNSSNNIPSYGILQTIITAQTTSIGGEGQCRFKPLEALRHILTFF